MGIHDSINKQGCAICGEFIGDRKKHTFKKIRTCLFASNQSLVVALKKNDEIIKEMKKLQEVINDCQEKIKEYESTIKPE